MFCREQVVKLSCHLDRNSDAGGRLLESVGLHRRLKADSILFGGQIASVRAVRAAATSHVPLNDAFINTTRYVARKISGSRRKVPLPHLSRLAPVRAVHAVILFGHSTTLASSDGSFGWTKQRGSRHFDDPSPVSSSRVSPGYRSSGAPVRGAISAPDLARAPTLDDSALSSQGLSLDLFESRVANRHGSGAFEATRR